MNDPRYRRPSRPPGPNSFQRDPRGEPDGFGPEEEAYPYPPQRGPGGPPGRRPSRNPDDPGGLPGGRPARRSDPSSAAFERRPSRGPTGPGPEYERRGPRGPDDADAAFERRGPRRPREPVMEPGMPPSRRPRYPGAERPGRQGSREDWSGSPSGPEWEPGARPRRPSRQRRMPEEAPPQSRWSRRRYRYGALLGIMLFAGVGGISLGFAGIGGQAFIMGLALAAVPALLLSVACAAAYIIYL